MTQEVLSAMSSDEVNSIGDTTESMQVALIVKRKTKDIWARSHLPDSEQLIQLDASTDADFPVSMTIPEEVRKINWIKYFNNDEVDDSLPTPGYQYVTILPMQQFIEHINRFNPNDDHVASFVFTDAINEYPGTYTFYYNNNRQPRYCTIISNNYVIFDAFNIDLENTLQNSKTMCSGLVNPVFRMEDDFTPNLTEGQFALLVNEAKALAFYELKQSQHPKAEQEIQRQWSALQGDKNINPQYLFNSLPNYGRK